MTDPSAVPLPPEIAAAIRSSCTPLLEHRAQFHGEFHASLVELMPEVRVMHEPAGDQVSHSLVNCVLWAVFATEPAPVVGATLEGVGLEVHRLGFPREGYQSVGHALLRTLRGLYPVDWSGSMSSAWIGYHAWLCEHWLRGAEIGTTEDRARIAAGPGPFAPAAELLPAPDDDLAEDGAGGYGESREPMPLGGGGRASRRRGSFLRAPTGDL